MSTLSDAAQRCIECPVPADKVALTRETFAALQTGALTLADDGIQPAPIGTPGRPARPRLVMPRDVPQRGLGTDDGRAALVHAIAHIEFNAIKLAIPIYTV